jgi:hypothetical protein
MNSNPQLEDRVSSSRSKHEGESSFGLCDRLCRTRDNSQRQLPTDQDYAVSTREYQTDQSSLKTAPTAAGFVLAKTQKQRRPNPQIAQVDRVTPYQDRVTHRAVRIDVFCKLPTSRLSGQLAAWRPSVRKAAFGTNAFPGWRERLLGPYFLRKVD